MCSLIVPEVVLEALETKQLLVTIRDTLCGEGDGFVLDGAFSFRALRGQAENVMFRKKRRKESCFSSRQRFSRMDKDKELSKIAEEIRMCPLCKRWGKGKAVPGEGNADAEIVFIGEAPGTEEARTGRPFVGRSGKFLRRMIERIRVEVKDVFVTSPVQYLPLRGTPSLENILHSRNHLLKQLSVIDPKIVVLLGKTACRALLEKKVEITKEHGTILQRGEKIYFIAFHPAYAVRFPDGRRGFVRDFNKLTKLLQAG
jgi:DNA polymerase